MMSFIAMKKYLIKGALALFAGTLIYSCADQESEYVPVAQQKIKAFEEVFKEEYGDIDPYQNWGFTTKMVVANGDDVEPTIINNVPASTRSFFAGTREIDVNGNLWDDCPSVGSKEEDDVVAYLQTNYVTASRPDLEDYFVTQIHKGKEDYWNVGGGYVGVGSDKMNNLHIAMIPLASINDGSLTAGWDHINNFNAGTCEDWTGGDDGHGNTLVKDGGTYDFAYQGAEDSKYHNRWIAIDGKDVPRTDGVASNYAGKLYICFDFEQSAATQTVFRIQFSYTHEVDGGNTQTDNMNEEFRLDGTYSTAAEIVTAMGRKFTYNGTEYTLTEDMVNGINIESGNQQVNPNSSYLDWIIRLVPAREIQQGEGSRVYTWNVIEDEWAQVTTQSGRVFCEDLGKAAREDLDYNDVVFDVIIWQHTHTVSSKTRTDTWDTKDGVKVEGTEKTGSESTVGTPEVTVKYYAQVKLMAAGGTIYLTVGGKEVHDAFGVGVTTMVNTRDANSTAFGSYLDKDPVCIGDVEQNVLFNGTNYNLKLFENISLANNVVIVSNFDGRSVAELTAGAGEAPHKLFVPFRTQWASERIRLRDAYPDFANYVTDPDKNWVKNYNTNCLYSTTYEGLENMPLVMKTKRIEDTENMDVLTSQSYTYGSSWSLNNVYLQNVTSFSPGDRVRFYGSGVTTSSTIAVVLAGGSYFITNTNFLSADKNGGQYPSYPTTACIEIILDDNTCNLLNYSKDNGQFMLQVQGQDFVLDRITRVPAQ